MDCLLPVDARIRTLLLGILIGSLLLTSACGSARTPPNGASAPLSEEAKLGKRVFYAHCHQCHPGGGSGVGPSLNNKPLPGFLIRFQVRHGLGAMPSFSNIRITDEQLELLVRYLQEIRRSQ